MLRNSPAPRVEAAGLAARRLAAELLDGVLARRQPLDDQLDGKGQHPGLSALDDRDRALMRRIVGTALRRLGTLRALLAQSLDRGLPPDAPRVESALLVGAAQILCLDVPDHAAVDLSVRLVQHDRRAARYAGLVNAVLRRIAREGRDRLAELEADTPDIPSWLYTRWQRHYGADAAHAIAAALRHEPALDVSVKSDPAYWAERLHGRTLPTGTVRTLAQGAVSRLPGFTEGAWWVQDAAAALPVRLIGDLAGRRVIDLCAAPGGKTAQLSAAGAEVTAVDRSAGRLERLAANLSRLDLAAEIIAADAAEWSGAPADAVLLDAPCTATGTLRRHPDIAWLKSEADIATMATLQRRLIAKAATLVKPGGTLVYATCSLEPEEGPAIVADFLAQNSDSTGFRRIPVDAAEIGGLAEAVTPDGDLRTLPCHWPDPDPRLAGLDGFYAARLVKAG